MSTYTQQERIFALHGNTFMSALCALWWVFFCVEFRFFFMYYYLFFISLFLVCLCEWVNRVYSFSTMNDVVALVYIVAHTSCPPWCPSTPVSYCIALQCLCQLNFVQSNARSSIPRSLSLFTCLSLSIKCNMEYKHLWRSIAYSLNAAHILIHVIVLHTLTYLNHISSYARCVFVWSLKAWNLYFSSVFESFFLVAFSFLLHTELFSYFKNTLLQFTHVYVYTWNRALVYCKYIHICAKTEDACSEIWIDEFEHSQTNRTPITEISFDFSQFWIKMRAREINVGATWIFRTLHNWSSEIWIVHGQQTTTSSSMAKQILTFDQHSTCTQSRQNAKTRVVSWRIANNRSNAVSAGHFVFVFDVSLDSGGAGASHCVLSSVPVRGHWLLWANTPILYARIFIAWLITRSDPMEVHKFNLYFRDGMSRQSWAGASRVFHCELHGKHIELKILYFYRKCKCMLVFIACTGGINLITFARVTSKTTYRPLVLVARVITHTKNYSRIHHFFSTLWTGKPVHGITLLLRTVHGRCGESAKNETVFINLVVSEKLKKKRDD